MVGKRGDGDVPKRCMAAGSPAGDVTTMATSPGSTDREHRKAPWRTWTRSLEVDLGRPRIARGERKSLEGWWCEPDAQGVCHGGRPPSVTHRVRFPGLALVLVTAWLLL